MRAALHSRLAARLSRHAGLRLFRMFARPLEPAQEQPRELAQGVQLRLLGEQEVLALCQDPELNLRRDGVAAAYGRGDLCVGAFDSQALAGYCWSAFEPLPHLDGVWVRFDRLVAWTYKSLVRPSHRGRGIAPALYRFADGACLERGRRCSVICVESHNRPSAQAALRARYAPSGYGAYALRGPRILSWSSPAAKRHAVSFFLPQAPLV
jgi:GNAT superfamily N-acetyltransferase